MFLIIRVLRRLKSTRGREYTEPSDGYRSLVSTFYYFRSINLLYFFFFLGFPTFHVHPILNPFFPNTLSMVEIFYLTKSVNYSFLTVRFVFYLIYSLQFVRHAKMNSTLTRRYPRTLSKSSFLGVPYPSKK